MLRPENVCYWLFVNRLHNKYHTLGNSFEQILYALVVLPEELLGLASGSDPANENGKVSEIEPTKYISVSVYQKLHHKCIRN